MFYEALLYRNLIGYLLYFQLISEMLVFSLHLLKYSIYTDLGMRKASINRRYGVFCLYASDFLILKEIPKTACISVCKH